MARKAELTEAEIKEQNDAYNGFFATALDEPMDYYKHATNAHRDDDLRDMVHQCGIGHLAWWWTMLELLYSRRGHVYDVTHDWRWIDLANDLSSTGQQVSVDQAKELVQTFIHFRLLNKESFSHGIILNDKVCEQAHIYATGKAAKQTAAWRTNKSKQKPVKEPDA
jgi:hypothetical protein